MSWGAAARRWTRISVDVLLNGGRDGGGEEVVGLCARVVLRNAYPMGEVLVLPDRVVLHVPRQERQLLGDPVVNSRLRSTVENRVREGVEKLVRRMQRDHGQQIRVMWAQPLRVELREGAQRRAEAYFGDADPHSPPSDPWVEAVGTAGRTHNHGQRSWTRRPPKEEQVTVLDRDTTRGDHSVTQPLDDLMVSLSCDGRVVGSFVAVGHATVGRYAQATLLVPQDKERVSRNAAELAPVEGGVQVRVHNRNGGWTTRMEDGSTGPRRKVPQGGQMILRVGDRLDLDRDATVVLTILRCP